MVAVYSDDSLISMKELAFGFTQSKGLLPALEELCDPKSLERVLVGRGPGSYTGLRVGVACAKALSFALKIPLIGVSSLRLFCPEATLQGSFLSLIDAKIGGVYAIRGKVINQKVTFEGSEELYSLEKGAKELEKVDYIVTPSWQPLRTRFEEIGYSSFPQIIERYPSADQFLIEAKEQFASGNYSLDGTLELLYLRQTQAEIERNLSLS